MHTFATADGGPTNTLRKRWLFACALLAAFLVLVTGIARLGIVEGLANRILFKLSLAVENNFGAWASGMLLLLLAVLAYDGYARHAGRAPRVAQAWAIIAAILVFFSFDEVASLHERLRSLGTALGISDWTFLIPLALLLAGFFARALLLLWFAGTEHRRLVLMLVLGFSLLGSVAVQEVIEYMFAWADPRMDAVRVGIEEGTELLGMLILLSLLLDNAAPFARSATAPHRPTFALLTDHWPRIVAAALALAPLAALLTVIGEDGRGRPADWISASLLTAAALLVVRPYLTRRVPLSASAWATAGLCLLASFAMLLVPVTSTRLVLGFEFSTRLAAIGAIGAALAFIRLGLGLRWRSLGLAPYALLAEGAMILPFFTVGHWSTYMLSQLLATGAFAALARDAEALPHPAETARASRHPQRTAAGAALAH